MDTYPTSGGRLNSKKTRLVWWHLRRVAISSALLALLLCSAQDLLNLGAQATAQAAALNAAAVAAGRVSHHPNTLADFVAAQDAAAARVRSRPPSQAPQIAGPQASAGKGPNQMPASAGAPQMHPLTIPLDSRFLASSATAGAATATPAGAPTNFTTSDGLVTVELTPGSVLLPSDDRTMLTGPLSLQLIQTQGGFHAEMVQIARFSLQVLNGRGRPIANVRLLGPLTIKFHFAAHELDGLNLASMRLGWPETSDPAHHIPGRFVPLTFDPKTFSLVAVLSPATLGTSGNTNTSGGVGVPPGQMLISGSITDANIASSEHLTMNDNQGDVTASFPLDLPPAAGGLTPPLQLVYSSAGPNGRHFRQSPASWVGDGWNGDVLNYL